ncbi:MAG: hypothetical protein MJ248_01545 [Bacilli bacterium]|nr:hypothetical protein [Bacilli bacterium]
MMDIRKDLDKNIKQKKLYIALTVLFGILTLLSIVLFIVFSNYKIQLIMQIVGSIVSSILMIVTLSVVFAYLLPTLYMNQYLKELTNAKESKVVGKIERIKKELVTARKGILFIKVEIDSVTYFCSDPEIVSKFSVSECRTFIVRDIFIVGVEDEN